MITATIPHVNDHALNNSSLQLAMAAAQAAHETRAKDVVILDLRELTPVFDYFVIGTGTSRRQLSAISEEVDLKLRKELNDKRLGVEGYEDSRWILLDFGNVVVHLFDEDTRDYYGLENLWSDAPRIKYPAEDAEDAASA